MTDNFDPKNCPVGISNEKSIENVEIKFNMAIQRLEEKLDDMKENLDKGFSSVNDSITRLERRFDELEAKLPEKIDDRIKAHRNNRSWEIIKWVIVTLLGSVAVATITNAVVSLI